MWQWQVLWYTYNAPFCSMLFHMKPSALSYLSDLVYPQHKPGLLISGMRYFKIIAKIKFLAMISGEKPHRPSCIETECACYGWMQAVRNRKDNADLFIPKAIMGGIWVATEEYRPCAPTGLAFSNPTPCKLSVRYWFSGREFCAHFLMTRHHFHIVSHFLMARHYFHIISRFDSAHDRLTMQSCSFPMHQTNSHLQR